MQKTKKMINLKDLKLFLLLIFFLTPFNSYAGYGKGNLTLTERGVKGFYEYLQGKKGKPLRAVVSSDGNRFFWRYCPAAQCVSEGDTGAIKYCESKQKLPCATFAVGRSVKWKNGVNPGGKAAAFKKSMSLDEVRERLITLGFYGDGSADTSNNNSDTKKFNSSISERLETLSNMHKKGLLTEEEFKKAKKKLLN